MTDTTNSSTSTETSTNPSEFINGIFDSIQQSEHPELMYGLIAIVAIFLFFQLRSLISFLVSIAFIVMITGGIFLLSGKSFSDFKMPDFKMPEFTLPNFQAPSIPDEIVPTTDDTVGDAIRRSRSGRRSTRGDGMLNDLTEDLLP